MDYFNQVPSEINDIIISYLSSDDIMVLLKTFNILNLNWETIHYYHFRKYKVAVTIPEYSMSLELENMIDRLDLNSTIDGLSKSTTLYLTSRKLERVPPEIRRLTNLKELYLYFNQLTEVPGAILCELTNLIVLNLFNNQLTSIPKEICMLTNLISMRCFSIASHRMD